MYPSLLSTTLDLPAAWTRRLLSKRAPPMLAAFGTTALSQGITVAAPTLELLLLLLLLLLPLLPSLLVLARPRRPLRHAPPPAEVHATRPTLPVTSASHFTLWNTFSSPTQFSLGLARYTFPSTLLFFSSSFLSLPGTYACLAEYTCSSRRLWQASPGRWPSHSACGHPTATSYITGNRMTNNDSNIHHRRQ